MLLLKNPFHPKFEILDSESTLCVEKIDLKISRSTFFNLPPASRPTHCNFKKMIRFDEFTSQKSFPDLFVAVVVHFYMLIVPCQPAIAEAPSLPRSPPVNVISNVCHLSNRPLVFVNILKSICQYPQQKFRVPSLVFTLAPGGCPSSTIPRESF